ncbi:hypothetical protein CAC42_7153 [Sphaceloma murrayae]|uniref:Uncharacterized protein n=1 Tax=Sphaceloma murrayae TaxID=2082308 RepID=A0A2K1QRA7_9PEZI|nr:hypothetical protein CAC42_7153 [Sphaceloma murrayae]
MGASVLRTSRRLYDTRFAVSGHYQSIRTALTEIGKCMAATDATQRLLMLELHKQRMLMDARKRVDRIAEVLGLVANRSEHEVITTRTVHHKIEETFTTYESLIKSINKLGDRLAVVIARGFDAVHDESDKVGGETSLLNGTHQVEQIQKLSTTNDTVRKDVSSDEQEDTPVSTKGSLGPVAGCGEAPARVTTKKRAWAEEETTDGDAIQSSEEMKRGRRRRKG